MLTVSLMSAGQMPYQSWLAFNGYLIELVRHDFVNEVLTRDPLSTTNYDLNKRLARIQQQVLALVRRRLSFCPEQIEQLSKLGDRVQRLDVHLQSLNLDLSVLVWEAWLLPQYASAFWALGDDPSPALQDVESC